MSKSYLKRKVSKQNFRGLPNTPGVYLYWNKKNKIIYVGKATSLKNRLYSYLNVPIHSKTEKLMEDAVKFSIIDVSSEIEALLLEAKLVRKFQPKYNIQLKDDKNPLYIVVTKDKYPMILTARRPTYRNKYKKIYGPFPSSRNVRDVLRFIRKSIPFATHLPSRKPCFYNQIGLCNPCPSNVENEEDSIRKRQLKRIYDKNILLINRILSGKIKDLVSELKTEMENYSKTEDFENAQLVSERLAKIKYITQPINPVEEFVKNPNFLVDIRIDEEKQLRHLLKNHFSFNTKITRIECYDVAHLMGTKPTASMVTFINGQPDKSLYRRFKIYQRNSNDDVSSLFEVAKRRIKHFSDWGIPDLIVVDGGKGQAAKFSSVFSEFNIPTVGLAKRFETIVIPGKDGFTSINPQGPALFLLQRMRNEAHRFARSYHHKLVSKSIRE